MNNFLRKTLPVANVDTGLLLLRVLAAAFVITHGYPKLMQLFSDEPVQFVDFLGLGPVVSLALSMFAEFICAIFIILGLFTRLAAIPLIINMAVAAVHAHADDPFAVKELSLLYLVIFTCILLTGAGRYSVDGGMYASSGKKTRRYL